MTNLTFAVLEDLYSIHRFSPASKVPSEIFSSTFYSITKTEDELSIVCPADSRVKSEKEETGWSCLKILGPLDFSLTGVLAGIAGTLKIAGISIFAVSTYDTDYILLKAGRLKEAREALTRAGYRFARA